MRLIKVEIKKENMSFVRHLPDQVSSQLLRSVRRESHRLTTYIKSSLLSHRSDYSVKTKTGMMRNRTVPLATVREMGGVVSGGTVIGVGLPYTHIHAAPSSFGPSTTIRPTKAKALTIPLRAAVDGRGVVKPEFRDLRSRTDLFTPSRRRGSGGLTRGILYQRLTGGRVLPLFLLRSSVTVPRRIFTDSVAASQESMVTRNVEADVGYLLRNMRVY